MDKRVEKPRIALESLGCKLNQAEIELLARQLVEAGYKLVSPAEKADIYILNTFTVTHVADRKSRHMLRNYHRRNPGASLVAIGCYAERSPDNLEQIEGVNLILDNSQKPYLLQLLEDSGTLPRLSVEYSSSVPENSHRMRAFIKIQDGCRNFCAYCIVPLVRSRQEIVPADRILNEVQARVADGYKEVVLTGTEIGQYNDNDVSLYHLIERILAETDIRRLRLTSLQPQWISRGLIGLWQDSRLCPHFHLSLQSGSDSILSRMKRRYTSEDYSRTVSIIREAVPDVAVTTDVIVGFPGETDAEFQESYEFCQNMQFARIHVFPYSLRPGTEAAKMSQDVPALVKKQRSRQMLSLARESSRCFHQQFLGNSMGVLWEQESDGVWSGLTGNYMRVYTKNDQDFTNRLMQVKLVKLYKDGVWGEVS